MDKLNLMEKQLIFLHEELRKVKSFFKESSCNFNKFFLSMKSSLKILNRGELFNDIHYFNYVNLKIIEVFTQQILNISLFHSRIHLDLKQEGNKIKQIEKEVKKKLKSFSSISKKGDPDIPVEEEMNVTFNVMSDCFGEIRDCLKNSFADYIHSLCELSETNSQMRTFLVKSEENYNDNSPLFEKKFNLLKSIRPSEGIIHSEFVEKVKIENNCHRAEAVAHRDESRDFCLKKGNMENDNADMLEDELDISRTPIKNRYEEEEFPEKRAGANIFKMNYQTSTPVKKFRRLKVSTGEKPSNLKSIKAVANESKCSEDGLNLSQMKQERNKMMSSYFTGKKKTSSENEVEN